MYGKRVTYSGLTAEYLETSSYIRDIPHPLRPTGSLACPITSIHNTGVRTMLQKTTPFGPLVDVYSSFHFTRCSLSPSKAFMALVA
jgi:hypothetical protein